MHPHRQQAEDSLSPQRSCASCCRVFCTGVFLPRRRFLIPSHDRTDRASRRCAAGLYAALVLVHRGASNIMRASRFHLFFSAAGILDGEHRSSSCRRHAHGGRCFADSIGWSKYARARQRVLVRDLDCDRRFLTSQSIPDSLIFPLSWALLIVLVGS